MVMSSFEPPGTTTGELVLTSALPGTWFELLDSQFRSVGASWDYLNITLPEGVYEARATAGGAQESQLLVIKPSDEIQREMTVTFPTVAPVAGLASSRQDHSDFTEWLSKRISSQEEGLAGLVLVLQNLDDGPKLRVDSIDLLDSRLEDVDRWPLPWLLGGNDIAGRAALLRPGPYVLRTHPRPGPDDITLTDQTIWLSPGWQTLVFLPNQDEGAHARGMSVHMSPLSRTWQPDARETLAQEAIVGSIRAGFLDVAPGIIELAQDNYATNPMLAITALQLVPVNSPAHTDARPLINELRHRIGYHPDLLALDPALGDPLWERGPNVSWPPMFDLSYRKFLLTADQSSDSAIGEDSPAERVAPFLRNSGPWLQWDSTSEVLSADAHITPTSAWSDPNWRWQIERRDRVPSSAYRQVETGIADIASFREVEPADVVADLGVPRLAELLRLPKALVQSAITEMGLPTREPALV
jgi:hypothetical protein